jgi:hypothetical protein
LHPERRSGCWDSPQGGDDGSGHEAAFPSSLVRVYVLFQNFVHCMWCTKDYSKMNFKIKEPEAERHDEGD